MTEISSNNKRIAKNTLYLYLRMLFAMGVGLYSSRVVLTVLGVEDFGIYNVVGGLVAMFSLLNGSLSGAIQRFLTFELGAGNNSKLKNIFSSSLNILFVISFVIFILAETIGLWFLNAKLDIPESRMSAANWVYQISLVTFIIGVISVPYNAAIIAHENFKTYSRISIFEILLKLSVVILLKISVSIDKLVLYSVLLLGVAVIIRFWYGFYCSKYYEECKYLKKIDISLCREMFSFSMWSFIGNSAAIFKTQGVSIILNIFYGVIVNTAQGIANQVSVVVTAFVNSFTTATNPQITKSYASKNYEYMNRLIYYSSRLSFFLVLLFVVPVCAETEYILKIWLNQAPQYAVIFTQLILFNTLIDVLSNSLITTMAATGKIALYQCIVGGLLLLNLPLSYLFLKYGYAPQIIFIISCVISVMALGARLVLLQKILFFSIGNFFRNVLIRVGIVSTGALVLLLLLKISAISSSISPIINIFMTLLATALLVWLWGLKKQERLFISVQVKKIFDKTFK